MEVLKLVGLSGSGNDYWITIQNEKGETASLHIDANQKEILTLLSDDEEWKKR